ncbi:hypothetical protein GAPWK_1657 [Gilliamella apicola]|uniref:hypothetical protein n=1 Tax=Gilliamella apicola TaxID=1196095 RepID=UPI00042F2EF2|nr:hypothetical protein [Gilliamella apicola]AHN26230.1 hypothetical protein GAPWK_1657 [Gilliamella apicola]PXV90943.1 hypothetical protein C7392_11242 [Gilliamella apicola]
MKRIVLLGLACFVLFGCGEKKITEEMLVGDWECRQNEQKAKWKNGTFQDFGEVKSEKVLITYKNYDGMLMKGRGDDIAKGNWSSVSSIVAMQDVKNLSISELFRHYISSKFEYISDKEYKYTQVIEIVYKGGSEEAQVEGNLRQKLEENCIKVVH